MASYPNKVYGFEEVSRHNRDKDCWLVISGKVYDVSSFMEDHPGGEEVFLSATGKDATKDFEDVGHSGVAMEMMDGYCIGEIDATTVPVKRNYVLWFVFAAVNCCSSAIANGAGSKN
ncbi:unnamed protein product [Linum trigynum]|uniref:Cytochrome b5 heme-binding domain-containing protein n=1 Tax=Linum trigynum TaxID=586398 RepID=A0AAV2D5I4_9ROSI